MSKMSVWSKLGLALMVLALAVKIVTLASGAAGTLRETFDWVFVVIGVLAVTPYLAAGVRGVAKVRRHEYPKPLPREAPNGPRKRTMVSSALRLCIALMGLLAISGTLRSAIEPGSYETGPLGWGMEVIGHLPVILLFTVIGISVVTVVWSSMKSSK
ncbi:hypothetical protein [Streptosporangium roseum]|uniref:hypothetical protein n=1 Tax=Streptosporangium roseum TaxID=2001 RepID=UPI0012DDCE51|nr:hypothetical protein [Streptosporangium roseum]